MRKLLCIGTAFLVALLGMMAEGATAAKKKSAGKKTTKSAATATKKSGTTAKKSSSSRRKTASRSTRRTRRRTVRSRQMAPTPERYKEIQQALSSKGYLPAEEANGQWGSSSIDAMKKFQADQNLEASGKINSLSLIALGLGPKHEAAPARASPPSASPAASTNP